MMLATGHLQQVKFGKIPLANAGVPVFGPPPTHCLVATVPSPKKLQRQWSNLIL
jgi:hypothetical protein